MYSATVFWFLILHIISLSHAEEAFVGIKSRSAGLEQYHRHHIGLNGRSILIKRAGTSRSRPSSASGLNPRPIISKSRPSSGDPLNAVRVSTGKHQVETALNNPNKSPKTSPGSRPSSASRKPRYPIKNSWDPQISWHTRVQSPIKKVKPAKFQSDNVALAAGLVLNHQKTKLLGQQKVTEQSQQLHQNWDRHRLDVHDRLPGKFYDPSRMNEAERQATLGWLTTKTTRLRNTANKHQSAEHETESVIDGMEKVGIEPRG